MWASAWLADPSGPSTWPLLDRAHDLALDRAGSAVGTASGGFQSQTDVLRIQWDGFVDVESGIGSCQLDVLQLRSPGKTPLGQRCICSEVMRAPQCDCAASPATGASARCETITPRLQQIARRRPGEWRMSSWLDEPTSRGDDDDFEWTSGWLLSLDENDRDWGNLSVCVPSEPFNLGVAHVSELCTSSIDCAPATPYLRSLLHPDTDGRVLCVDVATVPWLVNSPGRFCCSPPTASGLCLPAAYSSVYRMPPPPRPARRWGEWAQSFG